MKQKKSVIFFVATMTVIVIGLLLFAYLNFVRSHNRFPADGFALKILEGENRTVASPIYFSKNTSYQVFYPNKIRFLAEDGQSTTLEKSSFLHLSDGSISTLEDGVLVDFTQASLGYIDHYAISSTTLLNNDGNGTFIPEGRADIFESGSFLMKINDNHYLYVANEIVIHTAVGEDRIYKDFIEFFFPEEGVVYFVTMDEVIGTMAYQTTMYAKNNNDAMIDFTDRTIYTKSGTTLCLDDIDVKNENNLSIDAAMRIPYYDIQAIDGENGIKGKDGREGSIGKTGVIGMPGETGEEGSHGIDGRMGDSGAVGAKGSRGQKGNNGENLIDGDSTDVLPFASFTDFQYTKESVNARIRFNTYTGLNGNIGVYLYLASSGELVDSALNIEIGPETLEIPVQFTELMDQTRYELVVKGEYSFDESGLTGSAIFLSREFLTNEYGIASRVISVNDSELNVEIHNKTGNQVVRVTLKDIVGNTLDSEDITISGDTRKYQKFNNLVSNKDYTATIEYYVPSTDSYVMVDELQAKTLKKAPTGVESIIVATNVLSGKFELAMDGAITDPDHSIVSYNYELFDLDGNLVKEISSPSANALDLYPDNQIIYEGISYYVRGRVDYYDNEKLVSIRTGFSDQVVMIIPNVTVNTEFLVTSIGNNFVQMQIRAIPMNTTIVADDMHFATVIISSPEYGTYSYKTSTVEDDGTIVMNVYCTNLYYNMNYVVTISGYTDNLGDGKLNYNEWGKTTFKTSE